jgi:hypothetical protein
MNSSSCFSSADSWITKNWRGLSALKRLADREAEIVVGGAARRAGDAEGEKDSAAARQA